MAFSGKRGDLVERKIHPSEPKLTTGAFTYLLDLPLYPKRLIKFEKEFNPTAQNRFLLALEFDSVEKTKGRVEPAIENQEALDLFVKTLLTSIDLDFKNPNFFMISVGYLRTSPEAINAHRQIMRVILSICDFEDEERALFLSQESIHLLIFKVILGSIEEPIKLREYIKNLKAEVIKYFSLIESQSEEESKACFPLFEESVLEVLHPLNKMKIPPQDLFKQLFSDTVKSEVEIEVSGKSKLVSTCTYEEKLAYAQKIQDELIVQGNEVANTYKKTMAEFEIKSPVSAKVMGLIDTLINTRIQYQKVQDELKFTQALQKEEEKKQREAYFKEVKERAAKKAEVELKAKIKPKVESLPPFISKHMRNLLTDRLEDSTKLKNKNQPVKFGLSDFYPLPAIVGKISRLQKTLINMEETVNSLKAQIKDLIHEREAKKITEGTHEGEEAFESKSPKSFAEDKALLERTKKYELERRAAHERLKQSMFAKKAERILATTSETKESHKKYFHRRGTPEARIITLDGDDAKLKNNLFMLIIGMLDKGFEELKNLCDPPLKNYLEFGGLLKELLTDASQMTQPEFKKYTAICSGYLTFPLKSLNLHLTVLNANFTQFPDFDAELDDMISSDPEFHEGIFQVVMAKIADDPAQISIATNALNEYIIHQLAARCDKELESIQQQLLKVQFNPHEAATSLSPLFIKQNAARKKKKDLEKLMPESTSGVDKAPTSVIEDDEHEVDDVESYLTAGMYGMNGRQPPLKIVDDVENDLDDFLFMQYR